MIKLNRENAKLGLLVHYPTPSAERDVFGIIVEVSGRSVWHHQAYYNDIHDSWYVIILDRSGREIILDMDLEPNIFIINMEDKNEQTTQNYSSSARR